MSSAASHTLWHPERVVGSIPSPERGDDMDDGDALVARWLQDQENRVVREALDETRMRLVNAHATIARLEGALAAERHEIERLRSAVLRMVLEQNSQRPVPQSPRPPRRITPTRVE